MTPVKADRQADFESFIGEVIDPAVQRVRPQLGPLWRVLRPAGPSEGAATYALLFYGDATLDDWDLGALFDEAYGSEEGSRRGEEFMSFLVGEQAVHEFSSGLSQE